MPPEIPHPYCSVLRNLNCESAKFGNDAGRMSALLKQVSVRCAQVSSCRLRQLPDIDTEL